MTVADLSTRPLKDITHIGPAAKTKCSQSALKPPSTRIWGVPFSQLTFGEAISEIERLIQDRIPRYFITANLHYTMLTSECGDMSALNEEAAFILADGMPIVWRSKLSSEPLPERIAGSDLIYALADLAARKRYRVFFLGGADGVAERASQVLKALYPELIVAGTYEPPFGELMLSEQAELAMRVSDARPDLLLVALGQPRGEQWIARWHQQMNVPISVQLGGTFNFVTGQIRRSPSWVAALGLEWAWRLYCEPRRLFGRYVRNAVFLSKVAIRDLLNYLKQHSADKSVFSSTTSNTASR